MRTILSGAHGQGGSFGERKKMSYPTAKFSVSRSGIVLAISLGSFYDKPSPVSDADLNLMLRTCKLHMAFAFAGCRMVQARNF